jgi:hypothetical protein
MISRGVNEDRMVSPQGLELVAGGMPIEDVAQRYGVTPAAVK